MRDGDSEPAVPPNAELTGRGDNELVTQVLRMKSPLIAFRSNDELDLALRITLPLSPKQEQGCHGERVKHHN